MTTPNFSVISNLAEIPTSMVAPAITSVDVGASVAKAIMILLIVTVLVLSMLYLIDRYSVPYSEHHEVHTD